MLTSHGSPECSSNDSSVSLRSCRSSQSLVSRSSSKPVLGTRLPPLSHASTKDRKAHKHKRVRHEESVESDDESEELDTSQEFVQNFQQEALKLDVVHQLLQTEDKHINAKDIAFGWTPLLFVANQGCAQVLQLLLHSYADLRSECYGGNTALHVAARAGHRQAVECLIAQEADLNSQNHNGWTPLAWCAINGCVEVASTLIEADASVSIADARGRTPSMWAAKHGHLGVIEVLLIVGFDFHLTDMAGSTTLDYAQDQYDMWAALKAAAGHNAKLLEAAKLDDADAVSHAIQARANVNVLDSSGCSSLTWALTHDSLDMVEMLTKSGAKYEGDCSQARALSKCLHRALGATDELLEAARHSEPLLIEEALSRGAWVNTKEPVTLKTPLMWIAAHGALDAARILIAADAQLEQRDAYGWTAMHFAACAHNRELVGTLSSSNADVMATNYFGETALHLAARADDDLMVATLIQAGSGMEAQSIEGYTPLQLASLRGAPVAVSELLSQGADASVQDVCGCSVLSLAVKQGQQAVVRTILHLDATRKAAKQSSKNSGKSHTKPSHKITFANLEKLEKSTKSSHAGSRPSSASSTASCQPVKSKLRQPSDSTNDKVVSSGHGSVGLANSKVSGRPHLRRTHSKESTGSRSSLGTPKKKAGRKPHRSPATPEKTKKHAAKTQLCESRLHVPRAQPVSCASLLASRDNDGNGALSLAVLFRWPDLVSLLLTSKASVDAADNHGNTAIIHAATHNLHVEAEHLLAADADVNVRNQSGESAVTAACGKAMRERLTKHFIEVRVRRLPKPTKVYAASSHDGKMLVSNCQRSIQLRFEQLPVSLTSDLLEHHLRAFLDICGVKKPLCVEVPVRPITMQPFGVAYIRLSREIEAAAVMQHNGRPICALPVRIYRDSTHGA